jgi:glycosyltransferase involved in cell wall biosynthesis
MNPLISIIVPVYNTEKYISETIQSVVDQTYSSWELILVDDGSTDRSKSIIKEWVIKDSRIHFYYKENGGQASARNLGILKSKGQYIAFLDADDLYLKDRLEVQVRDLQEQTADFYYGGGFYYDDSGEVPQTEAYDWHYGKFTGAEFFKILYHSCAVNINTVLIERSFLEKVGLFDESPVLRGTEDWELWLRISLKAKVVYGNPARHTLYRMHDGGIHFQRANMLIGKWKIYEKHEGQVLISRLFRLREYRYIFRELFNALEKEDRLAELEPIFKAYLKKDRFGCVARMQALTWRLASPKSFLKISNKVFYRIGFRLERITYLFMRK